MDEASAKTTKAHPPDYYSEDFGLLQRMIDALYQDRRLVSRLDILTYGESFDLPADLQELLTLLPPQRYSRQRLADQLNSAISGHGWGLVYGTVE
ncbi:MAG: hypothetical protein LBL67_03805 [Coriobacteriales bacterium]|jgi:hypothetical protein|nr:hypothetical protein [Coriobacteriales bacterium]